MMMHDSWGKRDNFVMLWRYTNKEILSIRTHFIHNWLLNIFCFCLKAFRSSKDLLLSKKSCEASPPLGSKVSQSCSREKRPSVQVALSGPEKKMKEGEEEEESSSEDDAPVARLAAKRHISQDSSDYTDNSSGVLASHLMHH